MQTSTKILLGITGVAVLGVGVWLMTRKPKEEETTTTTTGSGLDPSAQPVDSLGSTLGNLITNIWGQVEKNKTKNKNKPNCVAPINGFDFDGVKASDYDTAEIKSMQGWLSSYSPDVALVIKNSSDDSTTYPNGIDGQIGGGFKSAYNMVRTACGIIGIDDLETKSGIA